jgi:chromosome segregation ATPase
LERRYEVMRKFTEEEVREVIRTAQVFASQFTEEQYRSLIQMQQDLADSSFVEAAWGVHRLEQEHGIPCSQAMDRYLELLEDKAKLESEVCHLRDEQALEQERLAEAGRAIEQATEERSHEERELELFKGRAEDERRCLEEELERAREEAHISREEIAVAGKLKSEVESHGLALDLVLRLSEEFAHDEDAASHLAEAVVEHSSLLEARETLHRENEALKVETEKRQEEADRLKADYQHYQEVLSQLRSNIAEEEALRRFQGRFQGASQVLECLARWPQVVPMRCRSFFCGARFWVDRGPTYFRTKLVCPCCGLGEVYYDDEALRDLDLLDSAPFKIQLGE